MHFNVIAPQISPAMARNAWVSAKAKVIGQMPDRRRIIINDEASYRNSLQALCSGWLIPLKGETEPVPNTEIEDIVVKFSSREDLDFSLKTEQEILQGLIGMGGIPIVLKSGKAEIVVDGSSVRNAPYFIMPWVPGADVQVLATSSWTEGSPSRERVVLLVSLFAAMAERVAELHERGIVHRDIKPNNARFEALKGLFTLLDFGKANWLKAAPRRDMGTFGYYPPELEEGKAEKEDVRTDVYGFGATCFYLLTGEAGPLYRGMDDPWSYQGFDFMFTSRELVYGRYYEGLRHYGNYPLPELIASSNLPGELKETELGHYLIRLLHPHQEKRPADMAEIADNMRRLGGQLLEHELWSTSA